MKKLSNKQRTADELRTDTDVTFIFFFTSDVFGCYENTTCLDPPRVGIKALSVQCCYTFTYKHSHSKRGIQPAATE